MFWHSRWNLQNEDFRINLKTVQTIQKDLDESNVVCLRNESEATLDDKIKA